MMHGHMNVKSHTFRNSANAPKNGEFCPIHHSVFGFYNRNGKCLLRGTKRFFK